MVTTPELVEIVAAVLDTHVRIKSQTLHQECLCGWVGVLLGYDHCAHQAAAVLAALTEAGTVEWGVTWDGAMGDPLEAVSLDAAKNGAASIAKITSDSANPYVVSRLTLPWTAVGE